MTLLLIEFGPEYGQVVGRLHPMVVHFPIALLIVAGMIEFLRFLTKRPGRSESAFTCLWIGAVSAAVVAYTGWEFAEHDPPGRSVEDTVFWHRWLAVAAASTALLAVFFSLARRGSQLKELPEKPWVRTAYRLCLTLAVGLCGGAGHLGGELVYGEGFLFEPLQLAAEEREAATDVDGGAAAIPLGGGGAGGAFTPGEDGDGPSAPAPEPVEEPITVDPTTDDTASAPPAASAIDFHAQVWPIFEARCVECHGPRKQKGKLRLDSREAVFDVPPDKRVILKGSAEKSELFRLVNLPADDLDIMPGKGAPLTAEQIGILRDWIDQGAKWPADADAGTAAAAPSPTELLAGLSSTSGTTESVSGAEEAAEALAAEAFAAQEAAAEPHLGEVTPPVLDVPDLDAAGAALAADTVAALLEQGALAGPIATNTEAVEVDFGLLGDAVGDAQLAALDGLGPRLVWLSLARTAVTDDGLAALSGFPLLQRLNLAETGIGDAGLAHVAGLHELETLNLFGSRVTDAGLEHLRGLASLRKLYLWRTDATPEGVEALQFDLPDCDIDFGLDLLPLAEDDGEGAGETDGG